MRIVILTPETDRVNEVEIVNQLFEAGLEKLHIRKPNYTVSDFRNFISSVNTQFHDKLVLHGGGFELWDEFNLGGIHLTAHQRSAPPGLVDRIDISMISSSFHKWSEITHSNLDFGYIFISPVFDSISKTNYKAGVDFRGLDKMRRHLVEHNRRVPQVVGLGGIDIPHLHILRDHHFDGAAIYGAVWNSPDPVTYLKNLLSVAAQ